MAVIVDYTFKMCFQLSICCKQGPPNVARPEVTHPPLSLSTGLGALIMSLKKLTQCINALKKLTLQQL